MSKYLKTTLKVNDIISISDRLNKLTDIIKEMKTSQNKMIASLNSCYEAIKSQEKKKLFNRLETRFNFYTTN